MPASEAVILLAELACKQHASEKAGPHHVVGQDKASAFSGLFDLSSLKDAAQAGVEWVNKGSGDDEDEVIDDDVEEEDDDMDGPLVVGEDLLITKIEDGELLAQFEGEVASPEIIDMAIKDGCVMKVAQPQRFIDSLWHLVAGLECKLGCLVGCFACIAPADVKVSSPLPAERSSELYICQTDGATKWEMKWSEEGKKECSKLFEMKAGDMMHVPRGVEAVNVESLPGKASTFVVLSAFRHWSWADLASKVVQCAIGDEEVRSTLPKEMQKSLPVGFLSSCSLQAELTSSAGYKSGAASLAAAFRALATQLESDPQALLPAATDKLASDFMRARLPPHPDQLPEKGPEPTMDCSLISRGSGLFMLLPVNGPEDPETPEGLVMLCTPLHNKRSDHMVKSDEDAPSHLHDSDDDEMDEDEEEEEEEKEGGKKKKTELVGGAKKAPHGKPHVHGPGCGHEHHSHDDEDDINSDSDDSDDDDVDGVLGPVFPATYSTVVSKLIASSAEAGAVSMRSLVDEVPNHDEGEVMRLAHMLWDNGFVVCIPSTAPTKAKKKSAAKRGPAADGPGPLKKKK